MTDIDEIIKYLKYDSEEFDIGELHDLITKNKLYLHRADILAIDTLGVKEIEKNIYIVATKNNDVICIGKLPEEYDYLYNTVIEYIDFSNDKRNLTIGKLNLTYH